MFTLEHVSKKFGEDVALGDISTTIGQGLNFIIGSSGSGKTTLLKILSGLEQSFEGEVLYNGQRMKDFTAKEKSYFYHHVFGFVWQDFNLLDDRTVLENVMLPQYLDAEQNKKAALQLLRQLQIRDLAHQKAGKLSGGQKQRVAIARELAKNPQVLLADEPTSALDEKSAKAILAILRDIAQDRTVIVVTHDTALIGQNAQVYELDKGALVAVPEKLTPTATHHDANQPHRLSPKNACQLALNNSKSKWGRLATSILTGLVATTLLLVTVSGAITASSDAAFDELFATYGQSILDLSVISSFTSAGSAGGQENDQPSTDVSQNIEGLYEKYLADDRVSHLVLSQAFDAIQITADGKNYTIESSGSTPVINALTAGVMPTGDGNEIVVPNSFVKTLGLTDQEALGKAITFSGSIYNWDSGEPVAVPVHTVATIVGVVDTTVAYDAGGQIMSYTVDDTFFFSKTALDDLRAQAQTTPPAANFTMRAKTPADLIALKDELNAGGIVPLGRFELVEDMVRLSHQTRQQSDSAVIVMGVLSLVLLLIVALMTAFSRRREYAIYQVSGYSNGHLTLLTAAETLLCAGVTTMLFLITSPLLNLATNALWHVNILSGQRLLTGVLLVLSTSAFSGAITGLIATTTKAPQALLTGEK